MSYSYLFKYIIIGDTGKYILCWRQFKLTNVVCVRISLYDEYSRTTVQCFRFTEATNLFIYLFREHKHFLGLAYVDIETD